MAESQKKIVRFDGKNKGEGHFKFIIRSFNEALKEFTENLPNDPEDYSIMIAILKEKFIDLLDKENNFDKLKQEIAYLEQEKNLSNNERAFLQNIKDYIVLKNVKKILDSLSNESLAGGQDRSPSTSPTSSPATSTATTSGKHKHHHHQHHKQHHQHHPITTQPPTTTTNTIKMKMKMKIKKL